MNDRWLRSFVIVAHSGSITKAAEHMNYSPQALHQQMNLLENDVGFQLFHRKKSGVTLTPAGQKYYKGVRAMLSDYDVLLAECRPIASQKRLRIPMNADVVAPRFLEAVCREYERQNGALPIDMISTLTVVYSWMDGLLSGRFDMIECFTIDGHSPENVHYVKLFDVNTFCVMKNEHSLSQMEKLTPREFNGCKLATMCNGLYEYLRLYLKHSAIHADFEEILPDRHKIRECCQSGKICLVSKEAANTLSDLRVIPLDFDCHVQSGIACRSADVGAYQDFFDTAERVAAEMPDIYL